MLGVCAWKMWVANLLYILLVPSPESPCCATRCPVVFDWVAPPPLPNGHFVSAADKKAHECLQHAVNVVKPIAPGEIQHVASVEHLVKVVTRLFKVSSLRL